MFHGSLGKGAFKERKSLSKSRKTRRVTRSRGESAQGTGRKKLLCKRQPSPQKSPPLTTGVQSTLLAATVPFPLNLFFLLITVQLLPGLLLNL